MEQKNKQSATGLFAAAKAVNLPISTRQSVEISRYLRYKETSFAKKFLEEVVALRRAVPFRRFTKDTGHKPGMAAGRFPRKAAKEFLRLVKSVEANAQVKGLNASNLKIIKILANKASIPFTGGRQQRAKKRTHLEIVVKERKVPLTEKQKITQPNINGKEAKKEAKAEKEVKKGIKKEGIN